MASSKLGVTEKIRKKLFLQQSLTSQIARNPDEDMKSGIEARFEFLKKKVFVIEAIRDDDDDKDKYYSLLYYKLVLNNEQLVAQNLGVFHAH